MFSLTLWSKNPGNKISLPCSGGKEVSCAIELPIGLHFNAFSVFLKTISPSSPLVETIDDAMRTLYNSGINYIYFPATKMLVNIDHNDRA